MPPARLLDRVRAFAHGPAPALPPRLDRLAEGWAALSGRGRLLVGWTAVALLVVGAVGWVDRVDGRWGGAPVAVLVAGRSLAPGEQPADLVSRPLPPAAIPPGALTELPTGARLAFALPPGAVLTTWHLDARGPAAGLPAGVRAAPIPVDAGWGVTAGGWVDVWALGAPDEAARLIAGRCAVLAVSSGESGRDTALVAMPEGAVGAVAHGLALGTVLLTHAPPP